jgi:hypothetical protein
MSSRHEVPATGRSDLPWFGFEETGNTDSSAGLLEDEVPPPGDLPVCTCGKWFAHFCSCGVAHD